MKVAAEAVAVSPSAFDTARPYQMSYGDLLSDDHARAIELVEVWYLLTQELTECGRVW